jgi:FAD dependent oxidoreductase
MNSTNDIPRQISTDLLVVGGGLAGTIAAIAAKRVNPKMTVWIVERYGFLGGMATAGYVFPLMHYSARNGITGKWKRLTGGLLEEIMNEMHDLGYCEKKARTGDMYSRFDPMMLRCVLDTKAIDAGVKILFHALMNEVIVEGNDTLKEVKKVILQTKRGAITFEPKMIIDASGDADVVFHAKGEYEVGREEDGLTQPSTLNFRIGNISRLAPPRIVITRQIKKEKQNGNPLTPRDDCLMFLGKNHKEFHFNQTRVPVTEGTDFTDPFELTRAEIEGRIQAERFIRFLREKVRGYGNSSVMSMGSQIGIRETRRIIGEHILTAEEIVGCEIFDDRIAIGNYSIDVHDPKGTATTDIRRVPKGKWYSIPYRSLIPKGIKNVLVAGRPISADHVAHSAIRVMTITSPIGQGAGVAAALLWDKEKSSYNVRDVDIKALQTELRNQKAILE